MIDETSSLRLKLLRFPPIIGVVYIHAYFTAITFSHGTIGTEDLNPVTGFIRVLVSQGLARVAVPLFFLMSGYLFFANFRWSQQTFARKVTTRMRTLLVPFLFWNMATLLFYATVQAIPALAPYFSGPTALIRELPLSDYANVLIGLKGYPIAYHFWFIRDLMVLILLAPLIALILRSAALPFLLAVYLLWVTGKWPVYIPDCAGVLFFSAGGLCALRGRDLFFLDRYGPAACLAYLPILLVDVLWHTAWFNIYLHRTGLIVGMLAALYLTRPALNHKRLTQALLALGSASFFVYAAHEPLLMVLRMLAYSHIPLDAPYTVLAIYLILPALVIAFLVLCHGVLRRTCPRLLGLATGGR